eukprot:CAMPEP_0202773310 /NCGR_PEP_ID=MMETSP1388-20130828/44372_1 /ASSEMBLY_ACC=CAM_ASM_000864 /TAXON_ID=37098 /ORGANISM="Isochrysis sp, Strain CCMP1244" /LENGTH=208 /DNA_ID=CAMNT_0049442327 /DNA_START=105 /DNA_END=727 /DNA_ORIENTATION=-
MSKRRSSRAVEAAGAPSKQRRGEPLICLVCGLYADGKVAVACSLLKELKAASVLVGDLAAKRAVSKKAGGAFEVAEYAAEVPHLPDGSIVIVAHDFAQPSRVAAAVEASGSSSPKLLCVIDTRSFLDEWESVEALPPRLREAAKTDLRAHLRDKKRCEVLAECVESADVIALSHAEAADADELEMLEAMLRALNPSAAVVRHSGRGGG